MILERRKIILVVDDEFAIRKMLRQILYQAGFDIEEAADGEEALNYLQQGLADLILLDWMMPQMSGIEVLKKIRKMERAVMIPIIMLTARNAEDDRVTGLEEGVDDYVTKPFSPRELVARIQAVLRRYAPDHGSGHLTLGRLILNTANHSLSIDSDTLSLGPREYQLLLFLMSHPGELFSRSQLLERVWKDQRDIEDRTVDAHIRRLRKLLTPFRLQGWIQTVRGAGYCLQEE